MTTKLNSQKGSAPNGPKNSFAKGGKIDTSDSATPETGDEADEDRLLGHSSPEEENPHHAASQENEDKAFNVTRSPKTSSSGAQEVRQSALLDRYNDGSGEAMPNRTSDSGGRAAHNTEDDDGQMGDDLMDSDSDDDISQDEDTLLWKARMKSGKIVNNEYVQITIISLIIINALMMGVATMDFVTDNPQVDKVFNQIDTVFLIIFTVEVVMQLFYLGLTLFADGWLIFDLLIVVFSWSFESLQIVRAFRIFRAFRLITRVKPLRDLVLAIGAVLPRMYAIAALLMLIFYIFSVLFTELFSELPLSDNYFGTLDASLFTCMEMMTLEWGDISREVMTHEPYAWAPFLCFIAITGFIVFNLIVAVVCDAVAVTEKTVRELDGLDSDDPERTLEEAQERIDLLQCHISDMQRTQQAVQDMIELMAGELLHLETERIRAETREAELRMEMERRVAYQQDMDTKPQIQSLERNYLMEKERRESDRLLRMSGDYSRRSGETNGRMQRRDSAAGSSTSGRAQRRMSGASNSSGRPSYNRDSSGKSIGSRGSTRGRSRRSTTASSSPRPKKGKVHSEV